MVSFSFLHAIGHLALILSKVFGLAAFVFSQFGGCLRIQYVRRATHEIFVPREPCFSAFVGIYCLLRELVLEILLDAYAWLLAQRHCVLFCFRRARGALSIAPSNTYVPSFWAQRPLGTQYTKPATLRFSLFWDGVYTVPCPCTSGSNISGFYILPDKGHHTPRTGFQSFGKRRIDHGFPNVDSHILIGARGVTSAFHFFGRLAQRINCGVSGIFKMLPQRMWFGPMPNYFYRPANAIKNIGIILRGHNFIWVATLVRAQRTGYFLNHFHGASLVWSTSRRIKSETVIPSSLARFWSHFIWGSVRTIDVRMLIGTLFTYRTSPCQGGLNA